MGASRYLNNEGIWIARGEVANTSHINKFGYQGTNATSGTIWDANGTTADWYTSFANFTGTFHDYGTMGDNLDAFMYFHKRLPWEH